MAAEKARTQSKSKTLQLPVVNGADILVEALIRQGVDTIFAYPGGASMPMHQALTHQADRLRTILPRHEQGGIFAAEGYARTTGKVGVCMATSGPGATNLVTGLADAKMDSCPVVAITGQVAKKFIGTDAFQETPIVEVCRAITKHHYLITRFEDIPRVVKEAFYVARSGRPGPVLIDFPKDLQTEKASEHPDYDPPMNLPGYRPEPRPVNPAQVRQVLAAVKRSKKPILYIGGGAINSEAAAELYKFAKRTNIPVTTTLMGIGAFPARDPQSLHMLGMHGTVYANFAINSADLLLAFGVRFDDRVTGKVSEFATHGKIVHIDNDPSEIHKNKLAHIPIIADLNEALAALNDAITDDDLPELDEWWSEINEWRDKHPLRYSDPGHDLILPQYAIEELHRQTADRDPFVAVGVGQHQMWAAQYYKFDRPRRWMSSSGLGAMGFGLPAAMGAQAANPGKLVIDIDGDGSFQMNIQELATLTCEKLPVKVFLLNNQHLGMVMQWEDRFHKSNRAHTYLGPIDHPEATGKGTAAILDETYPNFVKIAEGFGIQARQVRSRKEFPKALAEMLAAPGPYVLDILCPYQEHVLPMIPGGHTVKDIILE
ncbi:MAG: biosynthetic-type acetolactate synthase large subunit [Planctomycetia bacterium]|nr:biosynthetic-type acetolactate synthase large subunit [Planctomycetia bacterium]